MTDIIEAKIAELKDAAGDEYLLISHGLYWRPESAGYTGDKTKAGLYSKERADDHVKHGGLVIAYKNAQRFSPKCDPHVRWEIIEMENTALLAERERLRDACRYIAPYLKFTISEESPGYHPTMPSAVADFLAKTAMGDKDVR